MEMNREEIIPDPGSTFLDTRAIDTVSLGLAEDQEEEEEGELTEFEADKEGILLESHEDMDIPLTPADGDGDGDENAADPREGKWQSKYSRSRAPTHVEFTFYLDRNPILASDHTARFRLKCRNTPTALRLVQAATEELLQYAIAELYGRFKGATDSMVRNLIANNTINVLPDSYPVLKVLNTDRTFISMDRAMLYPDSVFLETRYPWEPNPEYTIMQVEVHIITVPTLTPTRGANEVASLAHHFRQIIWQQSKDSVYDHLHEWFLTQRSKEYRFPIVKIGMGDIPQPRVEWENPQSDATGASNPTMASGSTLWSPRPKAGRFLKFYHQGSSRGKTRNDWRTDRRDGRATAQRQPEGYENYGYHT